MNLSGIMGNRIQSTTEQTMDGKNLTVNLSQNSSGLESALSVGEIISGKVLESSEGEVTLSVDGLELRAKILEQLLLTEGQELSFLVKKDMEGQTLLMPLLSNTSQTPQVLQALQMANLPISEENQYMVGTMMREGISVSNESLQTMYAHMQEVGFENLKEAIGLTRMGIEVTPQNCVQYGNYENMTHSISMGMTEIMSELPNTFGALVQNGMLEQAFAFEKDVISIFFPQETVQDGSRKEDILFGNGTIDPQAEAIQNPGESGKEQKSVEENLTEQGKTVSDPNSVWKGYGEQATSKLLQELLTDKELVELGKELEKTGISKKEIVNQQSVEDLLKSIKNGLENMDQLSVEQKKALLQLLGSKTFGKIMTEQMEKQWMMEPSQVAKEQNVKGLYQRLMDTSEKLEKVFDHLRESGLSDKSGETHNPLQNLASQVNQMRGNLEFMNQINQFQTYVQLPIRMEGRNGEGDLYVYTNKKSLARKDGNVTALLHLDMDHLGPLDVFIAMQHNQVRTKFYLENSETIDFLADHMHILDEHLAARGYAMHAEVLTKEEMTADGMGNGFMSTMLCQDRNPNCGAELQGFDAKA